MDWILKAGVGWVVFGLLSLHFGQFRLEIP